MCVQDVMLHKSLEHRNNVDHMHEQDTHDMVTGVKRNLDENTEFIGCKRKK